MKEPPVNGRRIPAGRRGAPDEVRSGGFASWQRAILALAAIAGALTLNSCSKPVSEAPTAPAASVVTSTVPAGVTAAVTNTISENLLNGNWIRPDGGYVMEVRSAQSDGRLDAYYFNPRPINVARAEWRRENDGLHVFMELRDEGYPGATYKLRYLPDKDQLAGEYFQPVYQETYEVQFIRRN